MGMDKVNPRTTVFIPVSSRARAKLGIEEISATEESPKSTDEESREKRYKKRQQPPKRHPDASGADDAGGIDEHI